MGTPKVWVNKPGIIPELVTTMLSLLERGCKGIMIVRGRSNGNEAEMFLLPTGFIVEIETMLLPPEYKDANGEREKEGWVTL